MKKGQKLTVLNLNQVAIAASEAVHETVHNKIPEAIRQAIFAQEELKAAIGYLKALEKSQTEGG